MAITEPHILIVGCGPGSLKYLTVAASQAIASAQTLVGSSRLLALFPEPQVQRITVGGDIPWVLEQIENLPTGQPVVVLVSGDPGVCSLARRVIAHFGRKACRVIPGISSVQMAFAQVGLDWSDARILSVHGRASDVTSQQLITHDKILIFAGTPAALKWISELGMQLATTHTLILCEDMTLPTQRVIDVLPADLPTVAISSLATVLLIQRSLLI